MSRMCGSPICTSTTCRGSLRRTPDLACSPRTSMSGTPRRGPRAHAGVRCRHERDPVLLQLRAGQLAVEAGVHFCDLGGNTEIVFQQKGLDAAARAQGITVIPDCGLAPGMVNILAQYGISQLDTVTSVRIFVGGLPQRPRTPAQLSGCVFARGRPRLLHDALVGAARRQTAAGTGVVGARGRSCSRRRSDHWRRFIRLAASRRWRSDTRVASRRWSTRRSGIRATHRSWRRSATSDSSI